MTARRPLVRIGGRFQQLPVGDSLAGLTQRLPVYQTDTAAVLLELDMSQRVTLPVYQANGTVVQVGV